MAARGRSADEFTRALAFRFDAFGDEVGELRRFGVGRGRVPRVAQHARQIPEVLGLAVAIVQAREDPQHLDVPLQSDEIEPIDELGLR